MRFPIPRSLVFGIYLASIILFAQGQIYITESGGNPTSLIDCSANSCSEFAPCSPSAGAMSITGDTVPCEVYVDSGAWRATIHVDSLLAVSLSQWHYSANQDSSWIEDITLFIGASLSAPSVTISNIYISKSVIVVSNVNVLFISNCTIDMTNSSTYGASFGASSTGVVTIDSSQIIKSSGTSHDAFLSTNAPRFVMTNTFVDMLGNCFVQGTIPIRNATIADSYIRAACLFHHVETQFDMVRTVVSNMSQGLTYYPDATNGFLPSTVTIADSSLSGMSSLFNGTVGKSITLDNCSISDVQQTIEVETLAVVSSTNITDSSFVFILSSTSDGANITSNRCIWTEEGVQLPCFSLTSNGANVISPAHMMDNIFEGSNMTCAMSISGLNVTKSSSLVIDRLCVEGSVIYLGYLRITGAILTSAPNQAMLQSFYDSSQTQSDSIWEFNSIITGVRLAMNNHLKYQVTNALSGITTTTLPIGPPFLLRSPNLISIYLWTDPTREPILSTTYPIFPAADIGIALPRTGFSNSSAFGYQISRICPPGICSLNFQVVSVPCNTDCNPEHLGGCRTPNTCFCQYPWYGPTCDLDGSCKSDSPGNQFQCIQGHWISTAPVEQETISVPPNAGTVVVNGGLNISQNVIFSGLGAEIFVNGCVTINGDIIVELSAEEIKQIKGGGHSKTLITSSSNETCASATDLSLIGVTTGTRGLCEKVSTQNAGSRQALTVVFKIDSSGCSKSSKIVAIVVPTVLGVVIIAGIIGALVIYKVRTVK